MKTTKTVCFAAGLAGLAILATGCAMMARHQSHRGNSLYNFLYASQADHVDAPGIPVLSLPLRVGVAFVPDVGPADQYRSGYLFYPAPTLPVAEQQRMELMKQVSDQFKSYPFVSSIELIPSPYLTARGGFANLDQLRSIYNIDVIALLSYDQAQLTDESVASVAYWTVIGAFVVPAERNTTQTMLDGAVYDIRSRKLLFRAPGLSAITNGSSIMGLGVSLREDSERGFKTAATNLVSGMKVELANFQERVKNAPGEFTIEHKPGYTGTSSFGGVEVALVAALGLSFLCLRRKTAA